MSVLRIKDENGNVQEILAIKGEKGDNYVLTEEDKQEIAGMVSGGGSGGSDVDLSDYYTKSHTNAMLDAKLDKSRFDAVYSGAYSEGLEIEGNTVVGIGECTDVNIVIPEFSSDGTKITEVASGVFGTGLGADTYFIESIAFPPFIEKLNGEVVNTAYCSNLETLYVMNPFITWDNKGETATQAIVIDGIPVDIFYGGLREEWANINTAGDCTLVKTREPVPTMHYAYFATKEQVIALIREYMSGQST